VLIRFHCVTRVVTVYQSTNPAIRLIAGLDITA
jgi:hypothetical protein